LTLFDPSPKNQKSLLFGREREFDKLEKSIGSENRLIIITGLRRVGKTSLIQCMISTHKHDSIYLDLRDLGPTKKLSRDDTLKFFQNGLQKFLDSHNDKKRIAEYLRLVRGVRIGIPGFAFGIKFDFSKQNGVELYDLFSKLNDWASNQNKTILLIIDEAQYLQNSKEEIDTSAILAGIFDKLRRIKIILTGSEMGLLYEYLGDNDPDAPLYHRKRTEIRLGSLSEKENRDLLLKGFEENRIKIQTPIELDVINEAVKTLGSRIGWLVEFGSKCIEERIINREIIYELRDKSAQSARKEFEKYIAAKKKSNYIEILEFLANSSYDWSFLQYFVERESTKQYVKQLVDSGIIRTNDRRHYQFTDPVLEYSFKSEDYAKKSREIIEKIDQEIEIEKKHRLAIQVQIRTKTNTRHGARKKLSKKHTSLRRKTGKRKNG